MIGLGRKGGMKEVQQEKEGWGRRQVFRSYEGVFTVTHNYSRGLWTSNTNGELGRAHILVKPWLISFNVGLVIRSLRLLDLTELL